MADEAEDREQEETGDDERVAGNPRKLINDPLTRTEDAAPQAPWGTKGTGES